MVAMVVIEFGSVGGERHDPFASRFYMAKRPPSPLPLVNVIDPDGFDAQPGLSDTLASVVIEVINVVDLPQAALLIVDEGLAIARTDFAGLVAGVGPASRREDEP